MGEAPEPTRGLRPGAGRPLPGYVAAWEPFQGLGPSRALKKDRLIRKREGHRVTAGLTPPGASRLLPSPGATSDSPGGGPWRRCRPHAHLAPLEALCLSASHPAPAGRGDEAHATAEGERSARSAPTTTRAPRPGLSLLLSSHNDPTTQTAAPRGLPELTGVEGLSCGPGAPLAPPGGVCFSPPAALGCCGHGPHRTPASPCF